MRWPELGFAVLTAVMVIAFRVSPTEFTSLSQVRLLAGALIVLTAMFYLYFVDDKRKPLAGAGHRVVVGSTTGFVIALLVGGTFELYGLLVLVGALLGYIGFRWLKHVPL